MTTKLLLIEDVKDLGRSGDIVNVKPGFARNFLMPKKLGVIADKAALRRKAVLQEQRRLKAAEDLKDAEALAAKIEKLTLETTAKVDPEGHLYGSVAIADLVNMLQTELKQDIDKHWIQLKHPIKTLGTHTISVKLKEEVEASFTINVEAEDAD